MTRKLLSSVKHGESNLPVTQQIAFTSRDPAVMAREAEAFGARRADETWSALASSGKAPNRETVREFFVNPDKSIPFRVVNIARRSAQARWQVLCAQYDVVMRRIKFRRRIKTTLVAVAVSLSGLGVVAVLAHFLGLL